MKIERKKKRNKILIGMSGGVDSSVAALLLKKRGFDVSGGFMVFEKDDNKCCSTESENRAKEAARIIGIPFYTFNFERDFRKKVVSEFIDGYKKGITPNPCVDCNKEIKFGLFLKKALALGFDYIATGHYARLRREFPISNFQFSHLRRQTIFNLLRGKDKTKDQSYFLWRLNQEQLKRIIFPLGNYYKKQVREIAEKHNFPAFRIKESQDVCFIKTTVPDFLIKKIKETKGKIVNEEGKKIGTHQGTCFYTIGQRKGLGLSGGPYFVTGKDTENNILIASKKEKNLLKKEALLESVNWISRKVLKFPLKVDAQIRYNHKPSPAQVVKNKSYYKIIFRKPQKAITPGQSAVFYNREKLLGGGIINH